jgi:hypothetical protein
MKQPGVTNMTRESLISQTFLQLADTLIADFDIIDLLTILSDDRLPRGRRRRRSESWRRSRGRGGRLQF